MRITIAAVGRLREGPEASLVRDYATRATNTGKSLALGPVDLVEVDDRRAPTPAAQCDMLLRHAADDTLVALDERGQSLSSPEMATILAALRDSGVRRVVFAIGGADGHDDRLRADAIRLLSFGPMVWPHLLARIMLAEQLYRATTILAGKPYHRS